MIELVEIDLGDDQTIVVDVEDRDTQPGMGRAARRSDGVIDATNKKFDQVVDVVRPVATILVDKVRAILVWAPLGDLGVCESGDVGCVQLLVLNRGAPT